MFYMYLRIILCELCKNVCIVFKLPYNYSRVRFVGYFTIPSLGATMIDIVIPSMYVLAWKFTNEDDKK